MNSTKMMIRFFTIADYNEEEQWLREQHKKGWKFAGTTPPCFYRFEVCEPEDVIYRLDYKNGRNTPEYMQMLADYGWEYCGLCIGWMYLRKPACTMENENDGELFSDNASRLDMVERIYKTRLLPLSVIFLFCVIPNVTRFLFFDGTSPFFTVIYGIMSLIYVYLIVHCGFKLKKLKNEITE